MGLYSLRNKTSYHLDLSKSWLCEAIWDNHLSANLQEVLQPPITIITLKTICLNFYPTTPDPNELMIFKFPNGRQDLAIYRDSSLADVTTYSYHPVYIVNMDLTWKEKKTWFVTLTSHESHDVAKSPATRMSVQQPLQTNIEEHI